MLPVKKATTKAPVSIELLISKYQSAPTASTQSRWRNQLIERKAEFKSYFQGLNATEEQKLQIGLPFLFN